MAENFLTLAIDERKEILQSLGPEMGIRATVLEKDIWICWTLAHLFEREDLLPMAFKGGTSLSKAFNAIARFSEDIDITIDHRSLDPQIDPFREGISRTRMNAFRDVLSERTVEYVRDAIRPALNAVADSVGATCVIDESSDGERVLVQYDPIIKDGGVYWNDNIIIDFGGHNSVEPNRPSRITAYIASRIPTLSFPAATVTVLLPERTFWEKATLAHVACNRGSFPNNAERQSRHWYDLKKLSESEIGRRALTDRELLADVVRYKKAFFHASYAKYDDCLNKRLRLLPSAGLLEELRNDFHKMKNEGMFFEEPPSFEELIAGLRTLEKEINS